MEHCYSNTKLLETLFLSFKHPLIVIDCSLTVVLVNNAAQIQTQAIYGTSSGMGWIQAFHPEERDSFLLQFQESQKNKQELQTSIRLWSTKCQGYRTVSIKAFPHLDENGNVLEWIGTCLDIHHIKEIEQKLQEKNRDYEMLADSMPEIVFTSRPDGHVDFFNKKFLEYSGLDKDSPKGYDGWHVFIHPDDLPNCISKWTTAMTTGANYEIKYRLMKADGTHRWHLGRAEPFRDAAGNILKWFGTCTNIDQLVQIESKLLRVTEQLNLTLKAAHIGVWNWDLCANKTTVDDNILDLFNIQPQNFHGDPEEVLSQIHPDDRARVDSEIMMAVKENIPYDTEFKIASTGKIIAARGEVFRNENGEAIRMMGINWDITSRKHLEQERLKALQFAEEQGRKRIQEAEAHRRRLEEFIDIICHEIRNPLNGITGMISVMSSYLQPLMDSNAPFDINALINKTLECLNTIDRCAEQQRVIVDDVLDLSKAENDRLELNPTVFNPKSLLNSLQIMFNGLTKHKQLQIITSVSPNADRFFKADARRLSQILINLQSNSIKFTETGYVRVNISQQTQDGKCFLHFSVQDTGIGMTAEEVAKLFDKFAQANPTINSQYGGSGLGLAISKKLVELMGGTFEVKSEKGKGSQFHFSIQCTEVNDHEIVAPQLPIDNSPVTWNIGSKRILIVEDNVINQKILTNYLQQQDCLCKIANNGLEALTLCDEYQFDVIFMDMEMPVMGGLEATQKIREKQSRNQFIPIIGLSGNARRDHIEEAISCGMNDYLTKPYHKTDIYRAVLKFCNQLSDEPPNTKKRKIEDS